ncbi:MAG: alpha/beta fold hydrolase [Candidatus Berkiellales bacterium]
MSGKEIVIPLLGQKIAGLSFNEGKPGLPILALHGWLDNAASFAFLAPLLGNQVIALDLPGHGLSDHKPPGAVLHFMDLVIDIIRVADHLGWERFALLGHSLGAAVSTMIAGTIPDRIQAVALLDGLGPFTKPASQTPAQLRLFLEKMKAKGNKTKIHYASVDEAVKARLKANTINLEGARLLINRGLKQVSDGKWSWRTDPRLMLPPALLLTEEQVLAFLHEIVSPLYIIRPESGYPFSTEIVQGRLNVLKARQEINIMQLPGHHHLHMDNPTLVAESLQGFLNGLK